jgi:spore maturation protein CgeB
MSSFFLKNELNNLITYSPDIIFTSTNYLQYIPFNKLKKCKVVLWGEFYKNCNYENQISTISDKNKMIINKFSDKNQFLIWSQHSDEINYDFFHGYKTELGVDVIQILHCADKDDYIEPIKVCEFDFLWIGQSKHREKLYNEIVKPIKKTKNTLLEYNELNPIRPEDIIKNKIYRNSIISLNVHTEAQLKYNILLNERIFSSSLQGGFQICDNILARKYFKENELIISTKFSEIIEYLNFFRKEEDLRIQMINNMQKNILENHTYDNRIKKILHYLSSKT